MEFTGDARQLIEDELKAIMGRMTLSKKDQIEVEKELRSGYYEKAEAVAGERNSATVTAEDVKEVCRQERTQEEISACYMKTYCDKLRRAGLISKTIAYVIDFTILLGIIVVIALLSLVIEPLRNFIISDSGIAKNFAVIALMCCYFMLLEGRFGATVGKYMMGLRVLKTDCTKIGYKEAVLRNLTTAIGSIFLIFDVGIMLLFFREDKQRALDKVANTIVVHLR